MRCLCARDLTQQRAAALARARKQAGKRPIVGFLSESTPLGDGERAAAFALAEASERDPERLM